MTSPAGGTLPPVTVSRFEQVTLLIQRLASEKTDVFVAAMGDYAQQRRHATARGLTHTEAAAAAAQIAQQLGRTDVGAVAAEIQQSGLQASDPPEPRELLLAAGVRTAPAFLDVALQVCALIEMDADSFDAAVEGARLDGAIDDLTTQLRRLPMSEARARAGRALEHFTRETTGGSPGEAWSLLTGTVWEAIRAAITSLDGSASSSSTRLHEPTDGPAGTS